MTSIAYVIHSFFVLHTTYLFNRIVTVGYIGFFSLKQEPAGSDSDISPPRIKQEPDDDLSPPR